MRILISIGADDALQLSGIVPGLKEKYPGAIVDFYTGAEPAPLIGNHPEFDIVASPDEYKYDLRLPYHSQPSFDWQPPTYHPTDLELGAAPACDFVVNGIHSDIPLILEELYTVIQVGDGDTIARLRPHLTIRQEAAIIAKCRVVITVENVYSQLGGALNKKMVVIADNEITTYIGPEAQMLTNSAAPVVVVAAARKLLC